MIDDKVNKIEENLIQAQQLVEEAARLLCNEPGDSPGGKMWSELTRLSEKIAEPIHYTYRLRDYRFRDC